MLGNVIQDRLLECCCFSVGHGNLAVVLMIQAYRTNTVAALWLLLPQRSLLRSVCDPIHSLVMLNAGIHASSWPRPFPALEQQVLNVVGTVLPLVIIAPGCGTYTCPVTQRYEIYITRSP